MRRHCRTRGQQRNRSAEDHLGDFNATGDRIELRGSKRRGAGLAIRRGQLE
jgi:hypothetical protein